MLQLDQAGAAASKTSEIIDNGEGMQETIFRTLITKTGPIGLLLIWQLMQNKVLLDRIFGILESDRKANVEMSHNLQRLSAEVQLSRVCPLCKFPAYVPTPEGVAQ